MKENSSRGRSRRADRFERWLLEDSGIDQSQVKRLTSIFGDGRGKATNNNTVEIINENNLSEDKNSTSSTSNNNNESNKNKTKKDTSISIMITEQYHGYSRHSV